AAVEDLLQARFQARGRDVGQEAKLAEVDAEHRYLAVAARGADDHAVAAEHDLHVGITGLFGVRIALAQPGLHALAELDNFGLIRIGDDAQAPGLGSGAERLYLAGSSHYPRIVPASTQRSRSSLTTLPRISTWSAGTSIG